MRIRAGVATLLLAPVMFAVAGCEPGARMYHSEGLAEYRRGNYDAARAMFRAAVLREPEKQESAYYLARCYRIAAAGKFAEQDIPGALRELDEAVFYYGQAIEAYPGYAAAIEEKADALELKGKYGEALRLSIWAKENAGRTIRQLVNVAAEFEQRGDLDTALTRYRQAVAVEPDSALAHAELARFMSRHKHYERALVSMERAYELDPSEPGVAAELAGVRELAGTEVRAASAPIPSDQE